MMEDEIYRITSNVDFRQPGVLSFSNNLLDFARKTSLNLSCIDAISDVNLTFKKKLPPKHVWMFMDGFTVVHNSIFDIFRSRIIDLIDFIEIEPLIAIGKTLMRPTDSDSRYIIFSITKLVDCLDIEQSVWREKSANWGVDLYLGISNYVLKPVNELPYLFKMHRVPSTDYFATKDFAEEILDSSKGTVEIESISDLNRRLAGYKEKERLRRDVESNQATKNNQN